MGKKRIVTIDDSRVIASQKGGQKVVRSGKEHGHISDIGTQALEEAAIVEEKTKKLEKEIAKVTKKEKKVRTKPIKTFRGKRYLAAKKKIDIQKTYPLKEAIKLLKSISVSRFNGSVDAHLVVKKVGLKGEIKFPYSTGKTTKVAIANEEVLEKIKKGKIDFTTLIATPAMMPKILKYAKILGPRGLMPNPKAGTITDKPEELAILKPNLRLPLFI